MPQINPWAIGQPGTDWLHCRMLSLWQAGASEETMRWEYSRYTGFGSIYNWTVSGYDDPRYFFLFNGAFTTVYVGPTPSVRNGVRFFQGYSLPKSFRGEYDANPNLDRIVDSILTGGAAVRVPAGARWLFVGYSQGGAIAAYCAARKNNTSTGDVARVLSYGAPRAGAQGFEVFINRATYVRYMNDGDPIPAVVPLPDERGLGGSLVALPPILTGDVWKHWFPGWVINGVNARLFSETNIVFNSSLSSNLLMFLLSNDSAPSAAHKLSTYESNLYALALPQLNPIQQTLPPTSGGASGGSDWDTPPPPRPVPPSPPPAPPTQVIVPIIPQMPEGGFPRSLRTTNMGNIPGITFGQPPSATQSRPYYAARMPNSRKWAVYYAGVVIQDNLVRRRARHLARRLNDAIAVLQQGESQNPATLVASVEAELGADVL